MAVPGYREDTAPDTGKAAQTPRPAELCLFIRRNHRILKLSIPDGGLFVDEQDQKPGNGRAELYESADFELGDGNQDGSADFGAPEMHDRDFNDGDHSFPPAATDPGGRDPGCRDDDRKL